MKSMLFAAGLGTRLKPLTDKMPKALVPVAGRPLLDIAIGRLVQAGATEIVVNVHHFGEQIIDYVHTHDWGIPVRISDEREALLDTGGGLRKALPLFFDSADAPVLIHNVDVLSNAGLCSFYKQGVKGGVRLLVSERKTQRYLLFDDAMRLCGWTNVATGEVRSPYPSLDVSKLRRFAFSGIHLFSPSLLPLLDTFPQKFPIMDFYLSCCDRVPIYGAVQPGLRLLDVGKQDTLAAAAAFYQQWVDK